MTVQEAINRGNNLVATSVIGLAGFAFAPEIFLEDKFYKIDDTLLLLVGLSAVYWYRRGQNRFRQTIIPMLFVAAGILIKFSAILIEIKDKEDVGDDFGGIVLFILATILVYLIYRRNKQESS